MPTQSTWRTPYITEITLVRILPPYHAEQEEVLEIFRRRKKAFENFTKRPFHFMRQLDDPTLVYIIGEWASLEQHMTEGMIEFVDLIHINVPHSELPFGLPRHTRGVIGISRIRGLSEEADSVNARRLECRRSLRYPAAVQMHTIGEGMGIDPPNNEVEYVFLWSYEPDQYPAFMSILPPTCPLPGGNGELRAMTEFKVPSFDW